MIFKSDLLYFTFLYSAGSWVESYSNPFWESSKLKERNKFISLCRSQDQMICDYNE